MLHDVSPNLEPSVSTARVVSRLDLSEPLADVAAWAERFRSAEIPVLPATCQALEALRANEEDVDANMLGEIVAGDPLMTLKVLAHAGAHRGRRVVTDAETVTAALVMMGISPFFAAFGPQPSVDEHLRSQPAALAGLHDTLERSRRSANFALAFAVHRMDHHAAVIHAAALLHDFAEMLLWCHAPLLALELRSTQRRDPQLRSAAAQQAILNVELVDLQQALMSAWRLPELLTLVSDDRHADQPSVRTVWLAVRLARHTSGGWDNPAIPDDIREVAALLNLSEAAALHLVRSI